MRVDIADAHRFPGKIGELDYLAGREAGKGCFNLVREGPGVPAAEPPVFLLLEANRLDGRPLIAYLHVRMLP